MYQEINMAWRASESAPPEVIGGGGGIMEGEAEDEEAAAAERPLTPGKGMPPGPNLTGAGERKKGFGKLKRV